MPEVETADWYGDDASIFCLN